MKNKKFVKEYIYDGLGFPVLLEKAELMKIRGEWLLCAEFEEIADLIISALPSKPAGLTGAEIRFIRTYFNLSKRKFAEELNVTHTAVGNWEEADQKRAKIDPHVEINLRALVKLMLQEEEDFTDFYKMLLVDSKHFADEVKNRPLKIALSA